MEAFGNGVAAAPNWTVQHERSVTQSLLSLMEWGQGLYPLEKALKDVCEAFGAGAASLSRVRFKTQGVRPIGTVRTRSYHGGPTMSLVGHLVGEDMERLRKGVPVLLSQLDATPAARTNATQEVLERYHLANVGFICLAKTSQEADYLEFHFPHPPPADWDERFCWGAGALARTYDMRRPGMVTEALCQKNGRPELYNGSDAPILSTENPAGLTKSEWKVAILVSRGLAPKAVAAEQGVSITTVRTHLRNIYAKTGLDGYHQLALRLISVEEQRAFQDPGRMVA